MATKTTLPSVTSDIPRDLRVYLDRVRESLDRLNTSQLLLESTVNGGGGGGGGGGDGGGGGGGGGEPTLPCGEIQYPTIPTGLTVAAAFSGFMVQWDMPTYCGHLHTEVWAGREDDIGTKIQLGSSQGRLYSHIVGEYNSYWCFWIRHVNLNGVAGPFNATGGVCARTALDPEYLLDLLTGQITESQLYKALGDRINLIDGPVNLDGSVNNRVAAEALARETGIYNEASSRISADGALSTRIDAVVAKADGNATAIASEATARANADEALGTRIDTVTATTDSNTAAIASEATARANADGALGTRIDQVQADANGNSALITNINTSQIGYCRNKTTKQTTEHGDKTACVAAGHEWMTGLPWATAVKQVSVTVPDKCYLSGQLKDGYTKATCEAATGTDGKKGVWITGSTGALEQAFNAQSDELGKLSLQYTVKIDNQGYVTGFGLASTEVNGVPFSEFGVRADRFYIAAPESPPNFISETQPTAAWVGQAWYQPSTGVTKYWTGSSWSTTKPAETLPFVVQATATVINGETIPPGVYMDAAYVVNLNAKAIVAGTIDADRVNAFNITAYSKMTAGEIEVSGGSIHSSNYQPGSTGWNISYAGDAEFNSATIRGTVWATNGKFSGWILGGSATANTVGTGLYAGFGTDPVYTYPFTPTDEYYRFRVGIPGAQRIQWNGSLDSGAGALLIYNSSGQPLVKFGSAECYIRLASSADPDGSQFELNGVNQRLTVNDGARDRVIMGRHSDGTYGLSLYDALGNTVLTSGGKLGNLGWGGNLIPNSDLPTAQAPWGFYYISNGSASYTVGRDLSGSAYVAAGTHNIGMRRFGTALATSAIVYSSDKIAVVSNQMYELSVYVASHRCDARAWVSFRDANGVQVAELYGNYPTRSSGGTSLSNWARSTVFVTAPSTATYCHVGVFGDPADAGATDTYFWATRFYFGAALAGQTAYSEWSPAGVGALGLAGFPFTADTIGTYIANAAIDTAYIKDAAIKTAKIDDLQITQGKIADYNITFGASLYGSIPRSISASTVLLETLTLNSLQFDTHMLIFVAAYNNSTGFELQVGLSIDSDASPRAWSFTLPINNRAYASLCGVHNFGTGTHTIKVYARIPPPTDYDFGFYRPSSQTVYGNIFCIGRYK